MVTMRKIPLRILKTCDGDYIASSTESVGFFAMGETRDECIQNAREGLEFLLKLKEKFEFEVVDEEAGQKE